MIFNRYLKTRLDDRLIACFERLSRVLGVGVCAFFFLLLSLGAEIIENSADQHQPRARGVVDSNNNRNKNMIRRKSNGKKPGAVFLA